MRGFLHLTVVATLTLAMTSCHSDRTNHCAFAVCRDFTITTDSVVWNRLVAWSPDGRSIETNVHLGGVENVYKNTMFFDTEGKVSVRQDNRYPILTTPSRLVNATYAMAINEITDDMDFLDVSPMDIALALAMVKPERSEAILGHFAQHYINPTLPTVTDHLHWANAAWDVYCSTGDREWLSWAHATLKATLSADSANLIDKYSTLCPGAVTGEDAQFLYPPDSDMASRHDCPTMRGNVMMTGALAVLDEMAAELGYESDHFDDITRLKDAINRRLWNEETGRYRAYVSDNPDTREISDNFAQALWVIGRVADDDRAVTLVSKTPMLSTGITTTIPQDVRTEPFFTTSDWAITQALWCMAAGVTGHEEVVLKTWAELLRVQALYQPRHIHCEPFRETEQYRHLSCAAIAVALRVIMGINFTPDGLHINPHIPECLNGANSVRNLHYRNALFDIHYNGYGDDVVSIVLDGKPVSGNFIPALKRGRHRIVVNVASKNHDRLPYTLVDTAALRPKWNKIKKRNVIARAVIQDNTTATVNISRGGRYRMALGYSHSANCRTIPTVNGHQAMMIHLPRKDDNSASTTVTVELLPGRNIISFTPTNCELDSVYIYPSP